jgi:hypothetical protein
MMRSFLYLLLLTSGLSSAGTPTDAFNAGKALADGYKDTTTQKNTINTANTVLPGYTTTAPQESMFGGGDLTGSANTKISGCSTTPNADGSVSGKQECSAVNFLAGRPSLNSKTAYSNIANDPAVIASKAVSQNLQSTLNSLGYSNTTSTTQCTSQTITNPAQYIEKSCMEGNAVEQQQCSYGRDVIIDANSNYQCGQSVNAYEHLSCRRTIGCPSGGTPTSEATCTISSAPIVSYSGCSSVDLVTGVDDWGASQGDEIRTQVTCNEGSNTINIFTDAHGIWASGCGPSWHTFETKDYNGQLIAQHRPSWNSWNNPVASYLTGSCSGGYCNYKIEYLHLKFSSLQSSCAYETITDHYGLSYNAYICGEPNEMKGSSSMSLYGNGGTCPSHPYFTHTYSDLSEYSTTYYDYYKFYYAPNIAHTTHHFKIPQKAQSNCPSGQSLTNGQCLMNYPSAQSSTCSTLEARAK